MSDHGKARIPLLVLGTRHTPDLWIPGRGLFRDAVCVPELQDLQTALDAALAEGDTPVLLGGFQGDGPPPLATLVEMLAQSLLIDESQISLRLLGTADNSVMLRAGDIRLFACGLREPPWEELLDELLSLTAPFPGISPVNAWHLPMKPAQNAKTHKKKTAPLAPKPLIAVLAAAALAFCVGTGYLVYYAADTGAQDARVREVQALYTANDVPETDRGGDGTLLQFEALRALNRDCAGWLSIPGADVDLPVMQADDDSYYLSHDMQKKRSRYGALFLSADNVVARGGQSLNLSIFGHNTKNGSMFGKLHRFRELSFYKKNAVFRFDTVYSRQRWVVFAMFITNANPVQDHGSVFEWREQSSAAPENMAAFTKDLKRRSIIDTGIDVRPGDRLLSLTTCTYEIKDARLVVFARALREGEIQPETSQAKINPAPLYPAAWYVNYGGEKPIFG